MEKGLGHDNMIGCAKVVSVSTLCSKRFLLTLFLCSMTYWPYGLVVVSSCTFSIYSINTILYPYTLPLTTSPFHSQVFA